MSTDTRLNLGAELDRRVRERGGTRDDISLVLSERPDIVEQCAGLIVEAAREMKDRIELSITVKDGETFDILIAAGNYGWRRDWITAKRFPVRKSEAGERKLVVLYFNRLISSEDVIKEALAQGLERPSYEDCLRFGAQHPDLQRQFPLVFLHEPVRDASGGPDVLCLNRRDGERRLNGDWFDDGWSDSCRFVFVRPTAPA